MNEYTKIHAVRRAEGEVTSTTAIIRFGLVCVCHWDRVPIEDSDGHRSFPGVCSSIMVVRGKARSLINEQILSTQTNMEICVSGQHINFHEFLRGYRFMIHNPLREFRYNFSAIPLTGDESIEADLYVGQVLDSS